MAAHAEISQRDLRMRSREIAVLVPIGSRRRFVPADEFLRLGAGLSHIDEAAFRESLDELSQPYEDDPYDR